jgi:hypothetical protein
VARVRELKAKGFGHRPRERLSGAEMTERETVEISRLIEETAEQHNRSIASIAMGALLSRARSKNLRRAWAQHIASTIGPGLRLAS